MGATVSMTQMSQIVHGQFLFVKLCLKSLGQYNSALLGFALIVSLKERK
jgi:hypothetical protein